MDPVLVEPECYELYVNDKMDRPFKAAVARLYNACARAPVYAVVRSAAASDPHPPPLANRIPLAVALALAASATVVRTLAEREMVSPANFHDDAWPRPMDPERGCTGEVRGRNGGRHARTALAVTVKLGSFDGVRLPRKGFAYTHLHRCRTAEHRLALYACALGGERHLPWMILGLAAVPEMAPVNNALACCGAASLAEAFADPRARGLPDWWLAAALRDSFAEAADDALERAQALYDGDPRKAAAQQVADLLAKAHDWTGRPLVSNQDLPLSRWQAATPQWFHSLKAALAVAYPMPRPNRRTPAEIASARAIAQRWLDGAAV